VPILRVHVDHDTMRRLRVFSVCRRRPVDELVEAAIAEAAIQAVPCLNGEPIDAEFRAAWPAFSGAV
jgi:hypothetical protein